jgi:hypothetical protein
VRPFSMSRRPGADKPTPPICDHSKPASATISVIRFAMRLMTASCPKYESVLDLWNENLAGA